MKTDAHDWDGWTPEGHQRLQLLDGMSLSLSEKLDWLEEAHRLAERLSAQAAPRRERRQTHDSLPPATQTESRRHNLQSKIV